ncbi:hypothetical protein B0J11DRAFT_121233 [Dendryphion nanum]|uniref:Uncharacterized protein n=1 Tax=Dendryphion nanum TaxID=256645 RepID=A0A9P9D9F0_9PLEO|nr:hypothetical protein B0J11DRAFT_121233 [Dendryphion nanum]
MFQIPSAKRVRRTELQSPASSPRSSPNPELEELIRSRITEEYTFANAPIPGDNDQPENAVGSDGEEAELILFAGPTGAATTPQTFRIRLSSPTIENGEPGFLVKKPRSYYFADEPDSNRIAQLLTVAVDGKAVLDMSRIPWAGCTFPWKVNTIARAGMTKSVLLGHPPALVTVEEKAHKRARKGKKSRIALRKKMQAQKNKQSEMARIAQEKEEADKEKRTRRNREKKVKRKEREKAKKAVGVGVDGAAEDIALQE